MRLPTENPTQNCQVRKIAMSWNYRVIRKDTGHSEEPYYYQIHEVYYDEDGEVESWSEDPIKPGGTDLPELGGDLGYMVTALSKPALIWEELEAAAECRRRNLEQQFKKKYGSMTREELVEEIRRLVPSLCPDTLNGEPCVYKIGHQVTHRYEDPERMVFEQMIRPSYPHWNIREWNKAFEKDQDESACQPTCNTQEQ